MTKQLVIMRHAQSPSGRDDHARQLDETGRREAARIARELDERGAMPNEWLASDAARVRQTLETMAEEVGADVVEDGELSSGRWLVVWRHGLYHADRETLLEHLWGLDDETGVETPAGLAGHNPGLSELVSWLTGVQTKLPTGGTVLLSGPEPEEAESIVEQSWALAAKARQWEIVEFWRPRALG